MRYFYIIISLLIAIQANAHQAPEKGRVNQLAVSIAVDRQGQLWRVGVSNGFVEVSHSRDFGETFSKSVRVNQKKQKITARGEVRPKVAIGVDGEIYVTWVQNLSKRFSSYIWFSRSVDGGATFEPPFIVHQDRTEVGHAFEELVISDDGKVTLIWLDARELVAAKKAGNPYTGAAIYYAVSTDNGTTFQKEEKLADGSCECCRIATTTKPDGTVVALWRHVFEGGQRDHMIAEIPMLNEAAKLTRATFGRWKIDGCPHHGGALARGGEDAGWWGYHMAYFDGKDKKPGLYYSRMDGEAWVSFPAKKFGDNSKQARHPTLLSMGAHVWLVWLETAENNIKSVMHMTSADGGRSWSETNKLLSVKGKVDYPQLLQYKDSVYLAVNTVDGLVVTTIQP